MIRYIAAAILAVAIPTTAQASAPPDDDPVTVNIETLAAIAPILCGEVDQLLAAGLDPAVFIPQSVEHFAETNANAVGVDALTEFFHGVLVGCAAH